MESPLSDHSKSKSPESMQERVLSQFQGDFVERLNVEQMFILIDGVLPFEACLYYQVLPLFLEGSRLNLGMVTPDDSSAIDYVRRIITYHNFSLTTRSISSTALQTVLSAYLNYSGSRQSSSTPASPGRHNRKSRARAEQSVDPNFQQTLVVDSPDELNGAGFSSSDASTSLPQEAPHEPSKRPSPVSGAASTRKAPHPTPAGHGHTDELAQPPLELASSSVKNSVADAVTGSITNAVADTATAASPVSQAAQPATAESLNRAESVAAKAGSTSEAVKAASPSSAAAQSASTDANSAPPPAAAPANYDSIVADPPVSSALRALSPKLGRAAKSPHPPLIKPLSEIEIQVNHISEPVQVLSKLSPKDLLQELLGRVLLSGIGRLYFERQADFGRILWSQNGVLQSVLDHIELDLFQGVLNEIKRMAEMSMIPITQPKLFEVERIYQQNRLLLRFQFMPGGHGEEATLQVLRGAALKFYQQQQLSKLERDALGIARQLQTKLNELRDRARSESGLTGARLEVLPALSQLLQSIEHQLGDLKDDDEDEEISEKL
ncbi:MAG TPA: hypothetical protein V6C88_16460 [Chroococcidiopsis sp.]